MRMTGFGMNGKLTVKKDECSNGESFTKLLETEIRDADGVGKDKAQAICIKGPSGVNGAKDLTITSVYVTYKSETAKPDYFNGFSSENDAWTMSNGKWDAVNKTYIYKSNGSGTGTYALPDSYTGNMTVSWRMKVNQTDGRAFVMLKDKSNKDIAQVEFRGGEGGNHNIIADAGDGTSPGSSGNIVNVTNTAYEANTWYDVICIKGPLGYGTDMGAKDLTITSVYVTYKSETAKPDYFNGFSSENDAWTMSNGKWDAVNKTYIYKSNGSGTGTYALPDSYTGNMTVSWRMKVNQTDGRAFVMLKDKSNKDIAQVEFRGGTSENHNIIADCGDGTSPGSIGNIVNVTNTAYEADIWYDVKVVIEDGKYFVQIGDNAPVQFVGFKGAEATGEIQNITLGTRNANVELTIDDFTINVDKESE